MITSLGERVVDTNMDLRPHFEGEWVKKPCDFQPVFTQTVLLPWVQRGSSKLILDLGAGQGIESACLSSSGFKCLALDESETLTGNSYAPNKLRGDFVRSPFLPFKDGLIPKILFKDTLIFLSPEDRAKLFQELKRVMTPDGSLLIVSQLGDRMRVHYQPEQNKSLVTESFTDDDDWERKIKPLTINGTQLSSIEYVTTPDSLMVTAEKCGLDVVMMIKYNHLDDLSLENRWVPGQVGPSGRKVGISGFVMELVKM